MTQNSHNILIVDLNNFARYPSIAVGYLASVLRGDGINVRVLSPFEYGLSGVQREPRVKPWSLLDQKLRYWSAASSYNIVKTVRRKLANRRLPQLTRESDKLLEQIQIQLDKEPVAAVMISAYLFYKGACQDICHFCARLGIPVIIGGPYFAQPEIVREWIKMPGLTALMAGEPETYLSEFVKTAINGGDLNVFPGVFTSNSTNLEPAPALTELDVVSFPDYDDFPWQHNSTPIIPIITGRGCGWGKCTFCSDVTSSSGRTYRSRSPENVLEELAYQSSRRNAKSFVFTDLKLNSNIVMWQTIIDNMQKVVPGGKWICSIHVGMERNNGLSPADLQAAAEAGLTRITTGVESGSQKVLNLMKKGTKVKLISEALRAAHQAGISVRTTMILGYPGETASDVDASADFLDKHTDCIDRVMLNRLQLITGSALHRDIENGNAPRPEISIVKEDHSLAQVTHTSAQSEDKAYRKAVCRLLEVVHRINRKQLVSSALEFEGVM